MVLSVTWKKSFACGKIAEHSMLMIRQGAFIELRERPNKR